MPMKPSFGGRCLVSDILGVREANKEVCCLHLQFLCIKAVGGRGFSLCCGQDKANWSFWLLWHKYKGASLVASVYADWLWVGNHTQWFFIHRWVWNVLWAELILIFIISALPWPFITFIRSQLLEAPGMTKKANFLLSWHPLITQS